MTKASLLLLRGLHTTSFGSARDCFGNSLFNHFSRSSPYAKEKVAALFSRKAVCLADLDVNLVTVFKSRVVPSLFMHLLTLVQTSLARIGLPPQHPLPPAKQIQTERSMEKPPRVSQASLSFEVPPLLPLPPGRRERKGSFHCTPNAFY